MTTAQPRVIDYSDERSPRYGRLLSRDTSSESGELKRILWDDGTRTWEGDGNPCVVVLDD